MQKFFCSKLYLMLWDKLFLRGWRDSINRKLEILGDLQQVYQSQIDTIRAEMLEVVIIILIALEIILAF